MTTITQSQTFLQRLHDKLTGPQLCAWDRDVVNRFLVDPRNVVQEDLCFWSEEEDVIADVYLYLQDHRRGKIIVWWRSDHERWLVYAAPRGY